MLEVNSRKMLEYQKLIIEKLQCNWIKICFEIILNLGTDAETDELTIGQRVNAVNCQTYCLLLQGTYCWLIVASIATKPLASQSFNTFTTAGQCGYFWHRGLICHVQQIPASSHIVKQIQVELSLGGRQQGGGRNRRFDAVMNGHIGTWFRFSLDEK